jgi:hypothetical protein
VFLRVLRRNSRERESRGVDCKEDWMCVSVIITHCGCEEKCLNDSTNKNRSSSSISLSIDALMET